MTPEPPRQIGSNARSSGRSLHRSNENPTASTDNDEPTARTRAIKPEHATPPVADAPARAALRSRLTRQLQHPDTVLIEELGLCRGQVRADVAVVNGFLHAFEIKSDRDTLDGLLNQAATSNKILA